MMSIHRHEMRKTFNTTNLRHLPNTRWAELKAAAGCQHIVFLFMYRFTCSRCWRTAMKLGQLHKQLQKKDTTVVMVGDSHHIGPATRLAAELELPFPLIADDSGALRRLLRIRGSASSCSHSASGCSHYAVVLMDRQGAVQYCQDVSNPGTTLNAIELMAATENLVS